MKHLPLIVLLIFITQRSQAQFDINPHIGFNSSINNFDVDNVEFQGQLGFTAGLNARIGTDSKLFGIVGLQYAQQNLLAVEYNSSTNVELGTAKLKWIKIPLNMAYSIIGVGKLVRVHAQGGLTCSLGFGEDEMIGPSFAAAVQQRGFVPSWNVGAGLDVLFLTFNINYESGFSKLLEMASENSDLWTVTFGFKF